MAIADDGAGGQVRGADDVAQAGGARGRGADDVARADGVRQVARAVGRSRMSGRRVALKHGAITVSCPETRVPPDSVDPPPGPPAPRPALKERAVGEAEAGPRRP